MNDQSTLPPQPAPRPGARPAVVKLLIGAILAGLLAIFVIQNTDEVTFQFLAGDWTLSLAWLLIGTALAGAFIWEAFQFVWRRRRREDR
jgi:uncharacterized integral membrane protein